MIRMQILHAKSNPNDIYLYVQYFCRCAAVWGPLSPYQLLSLCHPPPPPNHMNGSLCQMVSPYIYNHFRLAPTPFQIGLMKFGRANFTPHLSDTSISRYFLYQTRLNILYFMQSHIYNESVCTVWLGDLWVGENSLDCVLFSRRKFFCVCSAFA